MNKFEKEIIKTPEHPLEYKVKMELQVYLMKKMIGENASQEMILDWIDKFAKEVSGIVDDENNRDIRNRAINRNFEEASRLIIEILTGKDFKKAA